VIRLRAFLFHEPADEGRIIGASIKFPTIAFVIVVDFGLKVYILFGFDDYLQPEN